MAQVLIVDADFRFRDRIAAALKYDGFSVHVAGDAFSAEPVMRNYAVNVVLTEVSLPGIDGLAFMLEARSEFPALPFIIMSGGTAAYGYLAVAQELGAAAVLMKPFASMALTETIRRVLAARAVEPRPGKAVHAGGGAMTSR